MPTIKYILQGLNSHQDHLAEFEYLMSIRDIKKIFISVAFVREGGISLIENFIKPYKSKVDFIIGIRNGVTSAQALKRLIKNKINPILVDTASTSTLFHPKIFLAYSNNIARIIIGSANLTLGGLVRNIEASSLIELDLTKQLDKKYLDDILNTFKTLKSNHPGNIFHISSVKQVKDLLNEGRLSDEYKLVRPVISGKKTNGKSDDIEKIKLATRKIQPIIIKPTKIKVKQSKKRPKKIVYAESSWILLWESKPLTERDLNVPSGSNTNPTGSMLLKQGNTEGIDQRHYFRENIFNNLNWYFDESQNKAHLERSSTLFLIIVKGINYGVYNLRLTHNTRTDTRSYLQSNAMTQLHWDDAKEIIAKKHLLGCILRLYKPLVENDLFIMDIE